MNRRFVLVIFLGLFMFSCIPQKKVIYLQKRDSEDLIAHQKFQYKIRPHDILHLTISSLNPQVSDFFNLKSDGDKQSLKGYMVNDSGYIYMPVLDSIKVKGMTVAEIQTFIQNSIKEHVLDATVIVKLANFKITVLGEVGNPGLISVDGDKLTILEALGMARDITEFGNKKTIRLIRKEGDASKFVTLDLTSRDIVASEYFYLQPDDVLYVEPFRAKNYRLNVGQLSLVIGLASFVLFLLNAVKN